MDSLDLSSHQLILSELALVLAGQTAAGRAPAEPPLATFASPPPSREHLSLAAVRTQIGLSDFCAALATNNGTASLAELQPVLLDLRSLLDALVTTEFEESMAWHGWAPADQLSHSIVLTLLHVAHHVPPEHDASVQAVTNFARKLAAEISTPAGDAHSVATRQMPLLNGFYRAISEVSFDWSAAEFIAMSKALSPLAGASPQLLRNLNDVLIVLPGQETAFQQAARTTRREAKEAPYESESFDTLLTNSDQDSLAQEEEAAFRECTDDESFEYRTALLGMYARSYRPFSGQFVLCVAIEILSRILSQLLAGMASPATGGIAPEIAPANGQQLRSVMEDGTVATQRAWDQLLTHPVAASENPALANALNSVLRMASHAYHDTYRFVLSEQAREQPKISTELYSLELLSESLALCALCNIGQSRANPLNSDVDGNVFGRIRLLLSEQANVYEPVLQCSALQSTGAMVMNFPDLVTPMTNQLRRFVTTPLAMFEPPAGREGETSPILITAAKALKACVTAHGHQDLVVSTLYTLLNHLGRDAGMTTGGGSMRSGFTRSTTAHEDRLAGRTDEQKAAITASTLAVVSRLALEVGTANVISLTLSMLLQRLRAAEGYSEALIMVNIVPLAISGTKQSFVEVIRAFSHVLRSSMAGGIQRHDSEMAHVAMYKLARGLEGPHVTDGASRTIADSGLPCNRLQEGTAVSQKMLYLAELLQLFAEKGKQLQAANSNHMSSEELSEMRLDLARLLPTIAELLCHEDLNPQLDPTLDLVSLFRNMWFLAVLFDLASPHVAQRAARDAAHSDATLFLTVQSVFAPIASLHIALALVALKTPTLVPETANNYLETELEFNSVLKCDFSSAAVDGLRKALSHLIPSQSAAIRSFKLPQVIFLLTIYNVEIIRSSLGRPSMLLWYFVNEGLNKSSLVGSMDAIAEKVTRELVVDMRPQMAGHNVDPRITDEVQNLVLGTVHRVGKVRQVSGIVLDQLFGAYPTLLCDRHLVTLVLEVLTLLRRSCETQFTDQYAPIYNFTSLRANVAFDLSDDYSQREEILSTFLLRARTYLQAALRLAPIEVKSILESYLSDLGYRSGAYAELGKSVAAELACSAGVGHRQETFLPSLGGWSGDSSSIFFAEVTAKSNYTGEMTGIHLALTRNAAELQIDPTADLSDSTIANVKAQLAAVAQDSAPPRYSEVHRLLYRTAALAASLSYVRP